MEDINALEIFVTIVISILSYFLTKTMTRIDELEKSVAGNKTDIAATLAQNNILKVQVDTKFQNLDEKFDMMYTSIKELTREIKDLNKTIQHNT